MIFKIVNRFYTLKKNGNLINSKCVLSLKFNLDVNVTSVFILWLNCRVYEVCKVQEVTHPMMTSI